ERLEREKEERERQLMEEKLADDVAFDDSQESGEGNEQEPGNEEESKSESAGDSTDSEEREYRAKKAIDPVLEKAKRRTIQALNPDWFLELQRLNSRMLLVTHSLSISFR